MHNAALPSVVWYLLVDPGSLLGFAVSLTSIHFVELTCWYVVGLCVRDRPWNCDIL